MNRSLELEFFEKLSSETKIPVNKLHSVIKYHLDDVYLNKKFESSEMILVILAIRDLGMKTHSTRYLDLLDSLKHSNVRIWNVEELIDSMSNYITISGESSSIGRHYDLTDSGMKKALEVLLSIVSGGN